MSETTFGPKITETEKGRDESRCNYSKILIGKFVFVILRLSDILLNLKPDFNNEKPDATYLTYFCFYFCSFL